MYPGEPSRRTARAAPGTSPAGTSGAYDRPVRGRAPVVMAYRGALGDGRGDEKSVMAIVPRLRRYRGRRRGESSPRYAPLAPPPAAPARAGTPGEDAGGAARRTCRAARGGGRPRGGPRCTGYRRQYRADVRPGGAPGTSPACTARRTRRLLPRGTRRTRPSRGRCGARHGAHGEYRCAGTLNSSALGALHRDGAPGDEPDQPAGTPHELVGRRVPRGARRRYRRSRDRSRAPGPRDGRTGMRNRSPGNASPVGGGIRIPHPGPGRRSRTAGLLAGGPAVLLAARGPPGMHFESPR